jgi:CheY-like chemotaxis protein
MRSRPSAAEPVHPLVAAAPEKILVVGDNPDARETLCLALEMRGHRVLRSGDGPDALEVMRRERPRVAVLDIGLPGMDGYELARRLRAEYGRDVVLIALTGYGTARDERMAMEAGFEQHLTKPVDADVLIEALQAAG